MNTETPGAGNVKATAKEAHSTQWYAPADIDPASGEKISLVLYQTNGFVVTIDASGNLNWTAKKHLTYAPEFGSIESQVALSENLVDRIFVGDDNKLSYKKMLGNALARLLDDKKTAPAQKMLREINHRILEHGKERVRMAYIIYALGGVALVSLLFAILIFWGASITPRLRVTAPLFQGLTCIFLGGIGAFISTFFRFKDYKGSLVSGLPIHRLDGALRIVYGMVAGLFLCLAVKGNIIAGFASETDLLWIMYFLAMVAGASELLVPNLIKQTETQIGLKPVEENGNGGGKEGKNPAGADESEEEAEAEEGEEPTETEEEQDSGTDTAEGGEKPKEEAGEPEPESEGSAKKAGNEGT